MEQTWRYNLGAQELKRIHRQMKWPHFWSRACLSALFQWFLAIYFIQAIAAFLLQPSPESTWKWPTLSTLFLFVFYLAWYALYEAPARVSSQAECILTVDDEALSFRWGGVTTIAEWSAVKLADRPYGKGMLCLSIGLEYRVFSETAMGSPAFEEFRAAVLRHTAA